MTSPDGTERPAAFLARELAHQRVVLSLLPPRTPTPTTVQAIRIYPNPFQARQQFRDLEQLSRAIQAHGLPVRFCVRPDALHTGYYQLVFGERWLRATVASGLTAVPCEVAAYTDDELFEIGLLEHIHTHALDPLEEAFALRTLIEQRGYSPDDLAARLGKEVAYVLQRLSLLYPTATDAGGITVSPGTTSSTPAQALYDAAHAASDSSRPVSADGLPVSTAAWNDAYQPPWMPVFMRRTLERDMRTLHAILDRWRALGHRGEPAATMMPRYLEEVVAETRQLLDDIQRNQKP